MRHVRSADGTEIAVECSGNGPPLVLVGGAFQGRSSMAAVAAGLHGAATVYEYDRRGRGASGNTAPYSVEREVEDLAAVIDATGEEAFVFGQSSGGALALEAASRAVPIRSLVVNEPPYTVGPSGELADHLERLLTEGRQSAATAAFLELTGMPAAAIAALKTGPRWASMVAYASTLPYEVRLCNDGKVPTDRLAHVRAATLALAGELSPAWAHTSAQAIADAVPSGTTAVLAGQGHSIAADVLVPVLTDFFGLRGLDREVGVPLMGAAGP